MDIQCLLLVWAPNGPSDSAQSLAKPLEGVSARWAFSWQGSILGETHALRGLSPRGLRPYDPPAESIFGEACQLDATTFAVFRLCSPFDLRHLPPARAFAYILRFGRPGRRSSWYTSNSLICLTSRRIYVLSALNRWEHATYISAFYQQCSTSQQPRRNDNKPCTFSFGRSGADCWHARVLQAGTSGTGPTLEFEARYTTLAVFSFTPKLEV